MKVGWVIIIYHSNKIIEEINKSSRSMEKLIHGIPITTRTGNSNNNDDLWNQQNK